MSETEHQKAKAFIEERKKILIVPHANVDPDGLSAALACHMFFSALGKDCTVICPDTLPESLEFLPGFDKLEEELSASQDFIITLDVSKGMEVDKLRYAVEDHKVNIIVTPKKGALERKDVSFEEGAFPFDGIIVVDSAELKLLGSLFEDHEKFFQRVPILNVDHHVSNTGFGAAKLINHSAASATEILYEWFIHDPAWKEKMNPDIATLLLTGLITDTRSFQNPNTTPRSLEVAAELLDLGARQQEIIRFIHKTKPLSTLKIWGRALNNVQVNARDRIVWSSISRDDLAEMEATSKETHGIIDELLTTIPEADVYILFTEIEEGGLKASMRSSEAVDVSVLSGKLFDGGGHARAAGFRMKDYGNFQMAVLECVQKVVRELKGESSSPELQKKDQGIVEKISEEPKKDDEDVVDVIKELAE